MRHRILLPCLLLSGFSGLAYELLWSRLLSLTFGSTTLSFSTVVAVFFGGLAVGSWLGGRASEAMQKPVRAYGVIEISTAILGLALYPLMTHLGAVFVYLEPGAGLGGAVARLLVAAPLLLVPTVLMGATLPIVCRAMVRRDRESARGVALIYGFNTLGAFLGVYVLTYHLLPALGVFRSLLATASLNLIAGFAALVADSRSAATIEPDDAPPPAVGAAPEAADEASRSAARRKNLGLALALTFLTGFSFICLEVVWSRLFSALLGGTVYGVGAVLICFLVGIGAGSLFIANRLTPDSDLGLWFAALLTTSLGWIWLLSRELPRIGNLLTNLGVGADSSLMPQHHQLMLLVLVLSLPTAASGASFPLLVRVVESRARETGRAFGTMYASNTVGSILGSLVTGFVLIPEFGSAGTILIALVCLALAASVGGALLAAPGHRWVGRGIALGALAIVAVPQDFGSRLMAVEAGTSKELFDDYQRRYESTRRMLVYFAEGRDGTVSVLDRGPGRFLIINGLGQGGRSKLPPHYYPESMLVGLVPVVHVEEPTNALLIGLGAGVTVEWLTELGVPRVKVAEIEPRVIGAVEAVFMGESPLDDDRVEVEIDDARHLLLTSAHEGGERYDIVSSMPAHPWVSANLFTREFFELAKANLSPKGVFSTWFGTIKMDAPAVESLFRAFSQVFPYYVIYFVPEAGSYYLVGADHPLSIDPDRIEKLLELPVFADERALKDPYFLPARLFATGELATPPPPTGIVNTDDSAFVEVHSPRAGKTSAKLSGFLPREYLHPSLVGEGHRKEFLIEVMEQLLGTPRGRFPESESPIELGRAARTLDAAQSLLTPGEVDYFRGRIALASGEREGARKLLANAAAFGGNVAERARKFTVLAHGSGTRERIQALLSLEPSSDVFLELLDAEGGRALESVPKTPVVPDEDPIGWFLWKAATTPAGGLSADDRSIFLQRVGPKLGRIARVGLLRAAEDFCRDQGLLEQAETFGLERRGVASPLANRLRDAGNAAGREGRFQEAADTLWQANQLEPANESIMQPLLRALVEIHDEERTAHLIEQFQFLGYSERKIEVLLQSARERQLAF